MFRLYSFLLYLGFACITATASAQSADEHMRLGDEAARSLDATKALSHYEAILAQDSVNFDALWKASMNAVDLGEFEKDKKKQQDLYRKGERYARRAVALRPADPEARFHLARSIGVVALSVGVSDRVKYAREVRDNALEALKTAPQHAGALHVMGVWNAEVMRLSGIQRTLAKAFLGAGFFSLASWEEAQRYMELSAQVDPDRITHHLDLARVYKDRKMNDKAKTSYQRVLDGRSIYYNDSFYKQQAAAELGRTK